MLHSDLYPAKVSHDGSLSEILPAGTFLARMKHLCAFRHKTTLVWTHIGHGRFMTPPADHLYNVARILNGRSNWNVNISWDLVQPYVVSP